MKTTYSPRAALDLAAIGSYLAERSPSGAAAVERRIRTVIELVAQFPASGRMVHARPTVSVIPLGIYPYRIFYTVSGEELIILHIRHTARTPIGPGEP